MALELRAQALKGEISFEEYETELKNSEKAFVKGSAFGRVLAEIYKSKTYPNTCQNVMKT